MCHPILSSATNDSIYFCYEPSSTESGELHLVLSFRLDLGVRRYAKVFHNSILHTKLQHGDMIAQDAMYHQNCLTSLYKKALAKQLEGQYTGDKRKLRGMVFGSVVAFIEES